MMALKSEKEHSGKTPCRVVTAKEIAGCMEGMRDSEQAAVLGRFFKTGKGEYGENDKFLGLRVPLTRTIVREARLRVPLPEIEKLLYNEWHEVRLAGFLLLVEEMRAALPRRNTDTGAERRRMIVDFYLRHTRQANNWDLVDLSCPKIVGLYLLHAPMGAHKLLERLAQSDNLWEQRIAIVSTMPLIKAGDFTDILPLVNALSSHSHDLMHKAMGWMLREVGKKDRDVLEDFLEKHWHQLPRTTRRYAIERFPEPDRLYWLKREA